MGADGVHQNVEENKPTAKSRWSPPVGYVPNRVQQNPSPQEASQAPDSVPATKPAQPAEKPVELAVAAEEAEVGVAEGVEPKSTKDATMAEKDGLLTLVRETKPKPEEMSDIDAQKAVQIAERAVALLEKALQVAHTATQINEEAPKAPETATAESAEAMAVETKSEKVKTEKQVDKTAIALKKVDTMPEKAKKEEKKTDVTAEAAPAVIEASVTAKPVETDQVKEETKTDEATAKVQTRTKSDDAKVTEAAEADQVKEETNKDETTAKVQTKTKSDDAKEKVLAKSDKVAEGVGKDDAHGEIESKPEKAKEDREDAEAEAEKLKAEASASAKSAEMEQVVRDVEGAGAEATVVETKPEKVKEGTKKEESQSEAVEKPEVKVEKREMRREEGGTEAAPAVIEASVTAKPVESDVVKADEADEDVGAAAAEAKVVEAAEAEQVKEETKTDEATAKVQTKAKSDDAKVEEAAEADQVKGEKASALETLPLDRHVDAVLHKSSLDKVARMKYSPVSRLAAAVLLWRLPAALAAEEEGRKLPKPLHESVVATRKAVRNLLAAADAIMTIYTIPAALIVHVTLALLAWSPTTGTTSLVKGYFKNSFPGQMDRLVSLSLAYTLTFFIPAMAALARGSLLVLLSAMTNTRQMLEHKAEIQTPALRHPDGAKDITPLDRMEPALTVLSGVAKAVMRNVESAASTTPSSAGSKGEPAVKLREAKTKTVLLVDGSSEPLTETGRAGKTNDEPKA